MEKKKIELNKAEAGALEKVMAKPPRKGGFARFILVVFILAIMTGFAWYFAQYQKAKQQLSYLSSVEGRQEIDKKMIDEVIEQVRKHIILPQTETPTLATIEDAAALAKEQPFFTDAKNGDKILIYSDRAFIYSPERDLLVNVGPVYFQNQEGAAAGETTPPAEEAPQAPKINLDIRNGSQTQGSAQNLANNLAAQGGYNISSVINAVNKDYSGVTLVNLGGKDVSTLESALGVTAVSALPEGEAASQADVVIIVGNQ